LQKPSGSWNDRSGSQYGLKPCAPRLSFCTMYPCILSNGATTTERLTNANQKSMPVHLVIIVRQATDKETQGDVDRDWQAEEPAARSVICCEVKLNYRNILHITRLIRHRLPTRRR